GEREPENVISVNGQGRASGEPDLAQIVVGVETRAETAREAAEENAEKMSAVREALRGLGVDEKDIQTTNYTIQPELKFDQFVKIEQRVIGYVVSNQVLIKVRDLDRVGEMLDAVTEAGANNIFGISFTIEDMQPLLDAAREQAVADARHKAQQLADFAGVRLGDLLNISEFSGGGPPPIFFERAALALGAGGEAAPPISPGTLEITVEVQLSYEIEQ
ncbi:MAG: SIMPL domain-containing protein, partial [Chloroflexi bacterium]|nr:SIMPL domain-containing protein [Chloroflexota bacterium]